MIELSLPEIIYLVSRNGAEYFYGVNDEISNLSEHEKNLLFVEAENKLVASELLEMDFDGNMVLSNEIKGAIDCLSFPDSIVSLRNPNSGNSVLFYRKSKSIFKLLCNKSDYQICNSNADGVIEVFNDFLSSGNRKIDDIQRTILFSEFSKASIPAIENYEKSKNEFAKLGFNRNEAEILADIYSLKETLMLVETEVLSESPHSEKYLVTPFEGKVLEITADISEEDKIEVKTITSETAMHSFKKLLSECGFEGEL